MKRTIGCIMLHMEWITVAIFALARIASGQAAEMDDPLNAWRTGVQVHPVAGDAQRHTIHTYYVTNPESPDGDCVLYYSSSAANGHLGELCVLDRKTGKETVLVRGINTEDAHRAACQQWTLGGKQVVYHDVRDGQWLVAAVDVESRKERILIRDRQLAFGQPTGNTVPIYGCHWNPGEHRDLELLDVRDGSVRTVVTAAQVVASYGDWIREEFAGKPVSIFFPVVSPDERRVFFKLAAPGTSSDFRSSAASHRQGIVCYDLAAKRFTLMRPKWGHPGWHPDSQHILEVGNLLIDSSTGDVTRIANLPQLRGCHPSMSPDGRLFVTDGLLDKLGGQPGEWGIVVCDARGGAHQIVHRFDNAGGAKSWRKSHPHPVFSADGIRIYFNASSGDWTRLYVAESKLN